MDICVLPADSIVCRLFLCRSHGNEVRTVRGKRSARPAPLTDQEVARYRRLIDILAHRPDALAAEEELRAQHQFLGLSSGIGKAVYASYSDEELLAALQRTAEGLGRAPAQHEVFFLYRVYLKTRFRTWPAALRAAGMRQLPMPDLIMPDWAQVLAEEPEICGALEDVAHHRHRLGYPPRKRDVPQAKTLCERFRSWENVIAAAESFEKWQEERRKSVNK